MFLCHTKMWTERFGGIARRRHRIGKAHAKFVIDSVVPDHVPMTATADARLVWIGEDDRGIELEIVALDLDDAVVVVHVMPTALRRR